MMSDVESIRVGLVTPNQDGRGMTARVRDFGLLCFILGSIATWVSFAAAAFFFLMGYFHQTLDNMIQGLLIAFSVPLSMVVALLGGIAFVLSDLNHQSVTPRLGATASDA